MQAVLQIVAGPDKGRSFNLNEGQTLVVGRGQSSHTQLRDPRTSRTHFQIDVDGGSFKLKDLGSAGGTYVNGEKTDGRNLKPGDLIRIGDSEIRFLIEGMQEDATVTGDVAPAREAHTDSAAQLDQLVGQSIGPYQIKREIARGATSMVFKARDTKNNVDVALKVLSPEYSKDEQEMQRFVRAMKTVLPIKHQNIVQIYNAGRTGAHCWVAMEFVDGEALTHVIERIGMANMLDWRYAFRVCADIARALEVAYDHQIIHRNITPANILIRTKDKQAKLGDLMLAKALEGTLAVDVTRPGQLIGELAYMSPERTRGDAEVDCRSDIYGLGATVYALLTGKPPHESSSLPELISKIRREEPEKPKVSQLAIPDHFQELVLQMLAKRPEERPKDPIKLLTDLERIGKFNGITL